MAESVSVSATGVSPAFRITAEELKLVMNAFVTRTPGDWAPSPVLGPNGGVSEAMKIVNVWFPWIDEKLVMPKYDGVAQYLGVSSNRPTYIKDYHMITLMRAADRLLAPMYKGLITAVVSGPGPTPPPTE